MSNILCSHAEPPSLISLSSATIDGDVENIWHTDFLWSTPFGMASVQRKVVPADLLSSHRGDDRLAHWIRAAEDCTWRYLILELDHKLNGRIPWNTSGELIGSYRGKGGISRYELDSLIESLAHFRNIQTRWTTGIPDTASLIQRIHKWTTKEDHTGYDIKRKPCERSVEDLREWALQSFHGVGPVIARGILKVEPEPLRWAPGLDLENIPRIGKKTAKLMRESLRPR